MACQKTGDVSVGKLNSETDVDQRIGGGHGWDGGTRVVDSRAGVRGVAKSGVSGMIPSSLTESCLR